jgi:hypothetical protein
MPRISLSSAFSLVPKFETYWFYLCCLNFNAYSQFCAPIVTGFVHTTSGAHNAHSSQVWRDHQSVSVRHISKFRNRYGVSVIARDCFHRLHSQRYLCGTLSSTHTADHGSS